MPDKAGLGDRHWAGNLLNANWAAVKALIGATGRAKRDRSDQATHKEDVRRPQALADTDEVTPVLAIDCEMVGVGPDGSRSALARCGPNTPCGDPGDLLATAKPGRPCGAQSL